MGYVGPDTIINVCVYVILQREIELSSTQASKIRSEESTREILGQYRSLQRYFQNPYFVCSLAGLGSGLLLC